MESFLEFARGPLFTATFAFMILGLVRAVFLQLFELGVVWRRSPNLGIPWYRKLEGFLSLARQSSPDLEFRPGLVTVSIAFYFLSIMVAVFLADHISLWRSGIGIGWISMEKRMADTVAVCALAVGVVHLALRALDSDARRGSVASDYLMIMLILASLGSGLLAAHPGHVPVEYRTMMAAHVLTAEAAFVMLPMSRLSRRVLYPVSLLGVKICFAPGGPEEGEKWHSAQNGVKA